MRRLSLMVTFALLGSLFVAAPARAERTVTITGGGYGHGIGMSQYGAYGRAKNGKSAEQILEHYYTGASMSAASMPGAVRVGLLPAYGGGGIESISFTSAPQGSGSGEIAVKVQGRAKKLAGGNSTDTWRVEASPTGGIRIIKNGEKVKVEGRTVFGDPSTPVLVKFEKYGTLLDIGGKAPNYAYGTAEFSTYGSTACADDHCLRLVLSLSPQKYLYGLGEVPSSWPAAALRSQAIAGRTYLLSKVQRSGQDRFPCGCAVYDSTIDQAYIGDSKRLGGYWDEWRGAVDDTKDQVVLDGGVPIQALYSSSSGGHTEDNENVWGGTPISYLRGVPDGPDRAGGANPNFTWAVEMSWSTFSSKLNAVYGTGELKDFQLLKPFGVSGRVTVVNAANDTGGAKIIGTNKTARGSGWGLRGALGLKDSLFRVDLGYEVSQAFRPKYRDLDGAPGEPISTSYSVPRGWDKSRGRAQDFRKGRITFNRSADKTVWQHGEILQRYDKVGRESSNLGLPTSDVWGKDGYKGATYDQGRILWSKDTGAHLVLGSFDAAYVSLGGAAGKMRLPLRDRERRSSWPNGGRRQRFQNGTLYLPGGVGSVFALWGPIDERYRALGEATSACGYPTDSIKDDGSALRADFQHGFLRWTQADGVKVTCN
jgi:SpoIID/LytB domain protein